MITQLTQPFLDQWPLLVAVAAMFIWSNTRFKDHKESMETLFTNLQQNINARFEANEKHIDKRIDDLREDNRTLNTRVNSLITRVSRIEGALQLPKTGTDD